MPVGEAVSAPRLHHQWMPNAAKFEGVKQYPELVKGLKAIGHNVSEARQGDAHSIWIDPKTGVQSWQRGADKRPPMAKL